MRSRLALGALLLAAAASVASVAAGWLEAPPPISAHDAAETVRRAMARAGVEATVDPEPLASSYQPPGGARAEVWQTFASVDGGTILVSVAHRGAAPLFIDDRSPNGAQLLLSEAQFQAVVAGFADPGRRDLVQRNVALTVAAALVLVVALALSTAPHPQEQP